MSEREDLQEVLDKLGWSYKVPEQREGLTPREGLTEYKKGYMRGYEVAVRDLKTKIDSVFNLIMEDDDEC